MTAPLRPVIAGVALAALVFAAPFPAAGQQSAPPPPAAAPVCWINSATGKPVQVGPPGWSPLDPDPNHASNSAGNYVRLPNGAWINSATGKPVQVGPPGWSPLDPDPNHASNSAGNYVRVPCPQPQADVPATPQAAPQGQTSRLPNSDYGPGGHAVVQYDSSGDELSGTVYDPSGTLRHSEIDSYEAAPEQPLSGMAVNPNEKLPHPRPLMQQSFDYDSGGHLQLSLLDKYDQRIGLTYTDAAHYGLHGERVAEEITNYRTDGYQIKDWSLGTHQWYTSFTPYKTPPPNAPAPATPAQPATPTSTNIGVLLPRSYLPGETITGSLWPSTYAENFKSVPGLSEYSFPIQLYHLADGSPQWSSLQIGVKGDGYLPVNANGTFSLNIPYDWKGPLQLQARQPDPVASAGPSDALLNIDTPTAAPTLPADQFPPAALNIFSSYAKYHLADLWEDATDLEETLDELYDEPTPDWARIYAVEDDLDGIYDDIDEVEDSMSPQEVIALAQQMYQEATSYHDWLSQQPNLTPDDKDDLEDTANWADFLDNEIGYNKYLAGTEPLSHLLQPYWTNPVMPQGKLDVIDGSFPIDPADTFVHIDTTRITPLAATPNSWYFMPPAGLTAGLHNYSIDSPLFSETVLPVFSMKLSMSADALHLHKGESTTWHLTLNGLNGLPAGAWGGSSDPTDLVGSAELSAAQKAAGPARKGFISLSVTNQSLDVITMQDRFDILDASFFAPSGSYKLDGGLTALKDGTFIILGVARAYLEPEIGAGSTPGSSPSGASTGPLPGSLGANWFPPFSLNYDPAAFSNSSFMTKSPGCPGSGAAPPTPTGGSPAATPCVESVINDLMPPKASPQANQVQDNSSDLTQLADAAKRVDEARKKAHAASQNSYAAGFEASQAWVNAAKSTPKETFDDWVHSEERLRKAQSAEKAMKYQYNQKPNDDNEFLLAGAEQDVVEAERAEQMAKQKVIDSFKPEDLEAYNKAEAAAQKAQAEADAARNEERAANEALEKLKQTAGIK